MTRSITEIERADPASWTDEELAILKAKHFGLSNGARTEGSGLILQSMADVQPVPLKWLWPGVIPLGKLTMLVGDPGLGKSLVILDIAARVTSGKSWPDGLAACPIGEVLLLSAEDDPADTIRPRLDEAGAIPSLVRRIDGVQSARFRSHRTDIVSLPEGLFEPVDVPGLMIQSHGIEESRNLNLTTRTC